MTTASPDPPASPKLRPWHLDRAAIVYVRQSTPQQVLDHQESTARRYAPADRAPSPWAGRGRKSRGSTTTRARAGSRSKVGPGSGGGSPRSPGIGSG